MKADVTTKLTAELKKAVNTIQYRNI